MKKFILCILLFCCSTTLQAEKSVEDLKQHVVKVLPSLQGWCSKEKALNFIDLVLETKPKVCVEIGVFGGASFFPVVSALKFLGEGIAIAVDPWDKLECIKYFHPIEDKADLEWWGNVNLDNIFMLYLNMLKRYNLLDYTLILKTTSEQAANEIDSIDILYIDGNHSEEVSVQDVLLYLPKVRPGGYIWINDSLWTSMQSAVDLLADSCDAVQVIDKGNCILFKKR